MKNLKNVNQNKMTVVEFLESQYNFNKQLFKSDFESAKEMEKDQKGYSEEDVREMLFMALYEPQEECCTTHTKDSIVRKVLKSFKTQ